MKSQGLRGFTLVEMLISVSIIALISSVILARFSDFDSSTILRSLAFEVATSVREAQVFSLGARGDASGTDFDVPYGVTFTPVSKQYTLFSHTGSTIPPVYGDGNSVDVFTTDIGRTLWVSDVCVVIGGVENCKVDGLDRLDISFLRPEFESLFNTDAVPSIDDSTIGAARIKVGSTKGTNVWIVEVGLLGNISVYKE